MTSFNSFDMKLCPCSVFTRCPFILAKIKETKVSWMFMNQRKKSNADVKRKKNPHVALYWLPGHGNYTICVTSQS